MSTHDNDAVAEAIQVLAARVKYLGNGDAASQMGAIEFLAIKAEETGTSIALAIDRLAASNEKIAEAIGEIADKLVRP